MNEPAPNAVWHRRLAIGAATLIAAFYFGSLFAFGNAERISVEFATGLRDETDASRILDGWAGVVSRTMQPARMGVWVEARLRVAISSQTRMLGIDMNRPFGHTHHHHHPSWVG